MNLPGRRLPRTFCQIDRTENDFEFGGNQTSKLSEKHYIYISVFVERFSTDMVPTPHFHGAEDWGQEKLKNKQQKERRDGGHEGSKGNRTELMIGDVKCGVRFPFCTSRFARKVHSKRLNFIKGNPRQTAPPSLIFHFKHRMFRLELPISQH
jgi:hypothetical protein